MTENSFPDHAALRTRLAADIAAGKTVSLSAEELAHPELRRRLPQLLEELTGTNDGDGGSGPVRVPGYTLLGEIGHGGMSTVYLARQHTLARHVALKIAPKWLAGDKRMQQRLLQEARAMARVSHPNIVAIHDILDIDDTVAIAMDWIDGLTLASLLTALPQQPQPDDEATLRRVLGTPASVPRLAGSAMEFFVRVVRDIAHAVHRVHAAGLLHLDIKPSNILVRRDGTPLLADFGVVREIDVTATHTRTFAGTPVYSAPEQLQRADRDFGPHTDVYALGMTLYEMLARMQPLRQLGLTRVLQDVLGGRIPPLASRAAVPADLANIVHKAISPEPGQRYANAEAFAADLTAFLEHRPVTARALTRGERLRRWARAEPWKASLAAVLLLAVPTVLGLGGYVWWQAPHVERAAREALRSRASELQHRAYQSYFITHIADGEASRLLRQAMVIDPSPTSLACLLAMAHEERLSSTAELLAEHAADIAAHAALEVFAAKVAAGRAFFDDRECAALRRAPDHLAKYVLALDRVFWAEDRGHEEAYRDAALAINEAASSSSLDRDPLLAGLQLWVTARAGSPEEFESLARANRTRWHDVPPMLTWIYCSGYQLAPEAARTFAEEVRARFPNHPAGWEMLVVDAFKEQQDHEKVTRLVDAASDNGVHSSLLEIHQWAALVAREKKPAAERALLALKPELLATKRRLRYLREVDPRRADEFRAMVLATSKSPAALSDAFNDAALVADEKAMDEIWAAWRRDHPDRVTMHMRRVEQLYRERERGGRIGEIAQLLADFTLPRRVDALNWRQCCIVLTSASQWEQLKRYALRWISCATDAALCEAHGYAGLAVARLGDPAAAAPHFGFALATPCEDAWFAHTLLEDAWLRVAPGAPASLRDPALAKRRIMDLAERDRRSGKARRGRWTDLVHAEVLFANGEVEAARKRLAGAARRGEPYAPGDLEKLSADAIARYGK